MAARVTVHIEADSASEARDEMARLMGGLSLRYEIRSSDEEPCSPPEPEEQTSAPEEAKPEPKRRGRPPKARQETEPAPNISASPEDRRDPEDIDEAEIVEEEQPALTATADEVKEAMRAYVQQFGEPAFVTHKARLIGAPRLLDLPDDPEVYGAVLGRLRRAVEAGDPAA